MIANERDFQPTYTASSAALLVQEGAASLSPASGPAGASVTVSGSSFPPNDKVKLSFTDSAGTVTVLGTATTDASGAFSQGVTIPAGAAAGAGKLGAKSTFAGMQVLKTFTVA